MPTSTGAARAAIHSRGLSAGPRTHVLEWTLVGVLALGLLVFFAGIYPLRGFGFPVGPDAPVYLWWTRLGGHEGLSAAGTRPGVPTLVLVIAGTLRVSRVQALAAVGVTGGICVGLVSAALVDVASMRQRPAFERTLRGVCAGILAGTFAAHLADGYLANLLQAVLFLAAAVAIATASRAGILGAGLLLAASALSHPQFFALACGILLLTAAWTLLRRQPGDGFLDLEGGRILAAIGGGGVLAGGAFAWLTAGPAPLRVDTSQDAFLRRAGRKALLHHEFRGRFARHLARYVLPAQIPLGAVGLAGTDGFLTRFLWTWAVVLTVGVFGSLVTGIAPAVRFFAFGYVLPILAALGLVRVAMRISSRSRPLAAFVALGLLAAIVSGAAFTWLRARPFASDVELERAALAGRVADRSPPGTPIVVLVEGDRGENVSFLAPRASNVLRDAFPPDRIRDAFVYVGSPRDYLRRQPTLTGDVTHDEMSRLYLRDIEATNRTPLAFVLAPFDRSFLAEARRDGDRIGRGVFLLRPHPSIPLHGPSTTVPPDAAPSSGWPIALTCLGTLVLLALAGFGWARSLLPGGAALALAPAAGAAGLILVMLALERLGAPLTGWGPPVSSAAVGGGGYLLLRRLHRAGRLPQSGAARQPRAEIP